LYILGVAYIPNRESSLILLDACKSPKTAGALTTIDGVKEVGV